MRKLTLILLCATLSMITFAQSTVKIQRVEPDSTVKEIVQQKVKSYHWSIMGTAGMAILDGDNLFNRENLMAKNSDLRFSGLVNVEYTISPRWGIYAEYFYNPYAGSSRYWNDNTFHHKVAPFGDKVYDFEAINHVFSLGVSFNMLNLLYECRPQKFQWYFNIAPGISFFDMKKHSAFPNVEDLDALTLTEDPLNIIPGDRDADKFDFDKQSKAAALNFGTTIEWNATRWLAVLANAQYRMYSKDYYDASERGNGDDNTVFAGLGLRWKINCSKKYKHVRDMAQCEFMPNMAETMARKALKKIDSIEPIVEDLDKKFKDLEPRVKALEEEIEPLRDSDMDGVPDVRDREPNTPQGVPVNSFGEQVQEVSNDHIDNNCYKIYYNTAKYDILPVSEITLSELVIKLASNPELKIEIRSYADEQGERTDYDNQKLTNNRSKQVKKTLVKKYGIKAERIVFIKGYGAVKGAPSIDYLPNRRTDICIVK